MTAGIDRAGHWLAGRHCSSSKSRRLPRSFRCQRPSANHSTGRGSQSAVSLVLRWCRSGIGSCRSSRPCSWRCRGQGGERPISSATAWGAWWTNAAARRRPHPPLRMRPAGPRYRCPIAVNGSDWLQEPQRRPPARRRRASTVPYPQCHRRVPSSFCARTGSSVMSSRSRSKPAHRHHAVRPCSSQTVPS